MGNMWRLPGTSGLFQSEVRASSFDLLAFLKICLAPTTASLHGSLCATTCLAARCAQIGCQNGSEVSNCLPNVSEIGTQVAQMGTRVFIWSPLYTHMRPNAHGSHNGTPHVPSPWPPFPGLAGTSCALFTACNVICFCGAPSPFPMYLPMAG